MSSAGNTMLDGDRQLTWGEWFQHHRSKFIFLIVVLLIAGGYYYYTHHMKGTYGVEVVEVSASPDMPRSGLRINRSRYY